MNKAFKKILERLEEVENRLLNESGDIGCTLGITNMSEYSKQIVQEVAEEYKDKPNIIDGLKIFLQEKFNYCAEQAEMNLEAECNSEIASYFRDRKELYLDRANIYGEVMREIDRLAVEYNNGWIPCSERLPEIGQEVIVATKNGSVYSNIYYDYIDNNAKEPCFHRWDDEMWNCFMLDVIAWQPLPEPFKECD